MTHKQQQTIATRDFLDENQFGVFTNNNVNK